MKHLLYEKQIKSLLFAEAPCTDPACELACFVGVAAVYWGNAPGQMRSSGWDAGISASVTRLDRSLMMGGFGDSGKGLSRHHLLAQEMSSECETVLSETRIGVCIYDNIIFRK